MTGGGAAFKYYLQHLRDKDFNFQSTGFVEGVTYILLAFIMVSFLILLSIFIGTGLGLLTVLVAGPVFREMGASAHSFSLYPHMSLESKVAIGLWILCVAMAFFHRIRFNCDSGYNLISRPLSFFGGAFCIIGIMALILAAVLLLFIVFN